MNILAIDSSSATASVALMQGDKLVSEFFIDAGLTHSQTLAPMVKAVLESANVSPDSIDLFAVTNGPGSFTGLRIAASMVQAMALVNNKPCVGVSSLHALALNYSGKCKYICACMDARRDQVYSAVFEVCDDSIKRITPDYATTIDELIKYLKSLDSSVEFVGDGAEACYNLAVEQSETVYKFDLLPSDKRYLQARYVAKLGCHEFKYSDGKIEKISLNYLKMPQAERLLKSNQLKI